MRIQSPFPISEHFPGDSRAVFFVVVVAVAVVPAAVVVLRVVFIPS